MTDSLLFTQEDVDLLRAGERWLIPQGCDFVASHFGGLADRLQQWLDQQAGEDAFDATIQRSVEDGSFYRAVGAWPTIPCCICLPNLTDHNCPAHGCVIDETDLTEEG